MKRAPLTLAATLLLETAQAVAAERFALPSGPERIAFSLFLVGAIAFFAWVAWLVLRR